MRNLFWMMMVVVVALGMMAQEPTAAATTKNDNEEWNDSALDAMADSMAVALGEVEVTAQRLLVKNEVDRLSYDVQADADSRTGTAMDVLRKVPLVSVDAQDNIKVKGGSSFKIYKNGHPDPTLSGNAKDVLKAIPASMIKRIEVITEPGAKYDAEGVTAILNIVMVSGSAVRGATGTVGAGIDIYGNPHANGYLTTQIDKVVASANYGVMTGNRHSHYNRQHSENTYAESGNLMTNDAMGENKNMAIHYGNLEASYEPDTLNLVSVSLGGYAYGLEWEGSGTTTMDDAAGARLYDYSVLQRMPHMSYYSIDGRADYQHLTHRKDEKLTLSYMLSASRSKQNSEREYVERNNFPAPYDRYNNHTLARFAEHTFQLDWTRPIAGRHTLETGVKYIYRVNRSHTVLDYGDGSALNDDNRFRHLTHVAAAYASWTARIGSVTARAGLRYEFSRLRAKFPDGSQDGFYRNLSDWVPSASVNWQMSQQNSLKMAFATRINRPGISYLNPAVDESVDYRSYGNPHLSSARTYSMSATFMHIGPKFTFNVVPGFSVSNNQITEVRWTEGIMRVSTYENTMTSRWVGLSGYAQWQLHAKSSLMVNANMGRSYLRSDALGLKNARWGSFFYAQLTQQLPWKLTLTASGGKWGGDADGLYGHSSHTWFHSLSLQRSFLKEDRLTVRVGAQNPFGGRSMRYTEYLTQGDVTGFNRYEWGSRIVQLNVTWRFGSLNASVKKTDKTIENGDMVGGASSGGQGKGQN